MLLLEGQFLEVDTAVDYLERTCLASHQPWQLLIFESLLVGITYFEEEHLPNSIQNTCDGIISEKRTLASAPDPLCAIMIMTRVESGCIGLEIFGPPHQTKKIFGRSAGVWLKFG